MRRYTYRQRQRQRQAPPVPFCLLHLAMSAPHFVLLPFMAQGHLIPMVDIARLLAKRNTIVTILLTPHNANRVKRVVDRAIDSGLSIRVVHLTFPAAKVGLPEGCENFDMLPSMGEAFKFFKAVSMIKDEVEKLFQQLEPKPNCFIADMCFTWATNVALSLHIPRIMFHGFCCFSLVCHSVLASGEIQAVASDTEYFVVPGLTDRIEITKAQLRGSANELPSEFAKMRDEVRQSEVESFGAIVNTFEELEPQYVKQYKEVKQKKVWCIGPVSLCNNGESDMADRGNKASLDKNQIFQWLDSQMPGSIIYVCLGSLARLSTSQLIELGLGLESSNHPFIWVVRNSSQELKTWLLEETFEERIRGRGLLIHGWAPQVLILSHPSVGCFLTHCGWNSSLEGITAGIPMITWPVFAEQFCNEKFLVGVIKTGIRVGVELPITFGDGEKADVQVQVKNDEIKRVIEDVMDGGEEGKERRERAKMLGEKAKTAMEEGGSSYLNMALLIQDVITIRLEQQDEAEEQPANDVEFERGSSSRIAVVGN